jgi:hypothetical protein
MEEAMTTFMEALAKLDDAKKQYRNTNNQSRWYKNSSEVISASLAVIEIASSFEEAEVAFDKAPASSDAKIAAYLKLMSFCTTIESLCTTSRSCEYRLGRTIEGRFDESQRDYHPFEHRWEKLSLEAVGAANSFPQLAKLYISGQIFGEAINVARQQLEESFARLTSFEELDDLEKTIRIPSGDWHTYRGSLRQMRNTAYDRLYFEKYNKHFRRQSINSDMLL